MKESEVLFLGVGQAGNNLTFDLTDVNKRVRGFYLNTTEDDLRGISTEYKYIFTGGEGTAKNRSLAQKYAAGEIRLVADKITEFKGVKYIFVAFAMGGGTGSGIAPMLMDMLTSITDAKVMGVPILPFENESVKTHANVLECWDEIVDIEDLGGLYLIDNNKRANKSTINQEFVRLFNQMLNMNTAYHKDGVIDKSEIGVMASAAGLTGIYDLSHYGKLDIADIMRDSIFAGVGVDCEYLGLSLPEKVDKEKIVDIFNVRMDQFLGYNDKNPLLIVSGSMLTSKPLQKIKQAAKEKIKAFNSKAKDVEDDLSVGGLDELSGFMNNTRRKPKKSIDDIIKEKIEAEAAEKEKEEKKESKRKKYSWENLLQ